MSPRTPLLTPQEYFDSENYPLPVGLGVWGAHVIGTMVFFFLIVRLLLARVENLPGGGARDAYGAMVPFLGLLIIVAIISLLLVAAIMHFMSNYAGGHGSYADAIAVAGWSYAPELLSYPVSYLVTWLQLRGETFDATEPEQFVAEVQALVDATALVDMLIALLVVGWSVYILAKGTAATHDVPVDKTIWPAVIIGIGAFLLRLAGGV